MTKKLFGGLKAKHIIKFTILLGILWLLSETELIAFAQAPDENATLYFWDIVDTNGEITCQGKTLRFNDYHRSSDNQSVYTKWAIDDWIMNFTFNCEIMEFDGGTARMNIFCKGESVDDESGLRVLDVDWFAMYIRSDTNTTNYRFGFYDYITGGAISWGISTPALKLRTNTEYYIRVFKRGTNLTGVVYRNSDYTNKLLRLNMTLQQTHVDNDYMMLTHSLHRSGAYSVTGYLKDVELFKYVVGTGAITTYNQSIRMRYDVTENNTLYGTHTSGNLASFPTVDKNYYNITETLGANCLELRFNFTGVPNNATIYYGVSVWGRYVGNPAHNVSIQFYDFTNSVWRHFETIPSGTGLDWYNITISASCICGSDFNNAGTIRGRIIHIENGSVGHSLSIDYIKLCIILLSAGSGAVGGNSNWFLPLILLIIIILLFLYRIFEGN